MPLGPPRAFRGVKLAMNNQVREARAERGISQAALGEALGVSRQTINAIETGRYMPSLPLAFTLARFFETRIEGLFDPEEGELR
jgi:putative transcriptional regulator